MNETPVTSINATALELMKLVMEADSDRPKTDEKYILDLYTKCVKTIRSALNM